MSARQSLADVGASPEQRPGPAERSAPGLPRVLAGIPASGALALGEHLALHGDLPDSHAHRRGRSRRDGALIDEVERAGLLGRGGAAFPTATKLRAVAAARSTLGARPIVVVNAAEGEPASIKDRTLLCALPHVVLDGALLAARAIGAREVLVGMCESQPEVREALARALAERRTFGDALAGAIDVQLQPVPNRYVAGQESALVNHLSGGPALPTFTPPRPFERGVGGRPTLVCNVETLAHLALIARHGAEWFCELGTAEQPGSALVTLAGPVAHPGVYEIEHGSSLTALLDAADGPTAEVRAVLIGGYSGTWVDGAWMPRLALSNHHLHPYGASLGAGVVLALSTRACPIAELARLTRWLASQSARQCGPCVFGVDAIATVFEQLALPAALDRRGAERRLRTLAAVIDGRGACSHPDGVSSLVASAVEVFADELAEHARRGPCTACSRPSELPGLAAP